MTAASGRQKACGLAIGATVLLLAVGSCSGGGEASSAAACPTPGITLDTVKVGLVYPDTGALAAPFTPARSGFEARIDLANDEGGVLGRTIELVWEDDAGAPGQNGLVAQGLVNREGVFAMAELTTAASGSAQYLADAGIPVVGLAADATWNNYDNMFVAGYLYSDGESVTTFGDFVAAQGGTKVAVVEDPLSDSSQSFSDQLLDSMAYHNIEAVARLPYSAGQTSAARTVATIADSGADVLIGQLSVDGFVEVLAAARDIGLTFKVASSPTVYNKDLLARVGQDLAGVTVFFDHIPWESSSPQLARYREVMTRYSPETSDPDQAVVLSAYVGADLLVKGLELAGECPTREAFNTRLRAQTDYDAAGLIPGGVDLSTIRGKVSLCYSFVTVNPEGTAFVTIPSPDGGDQWCGERRERQAPAPAAG